MKNKAEEIKKNPANLDIKLRNRIENGNKLIEDLKTQDYCTPYADSILMAARFNKMRILEAHISTYSDAGGLRERKINETDPATGRNALHYLSYMANSDMIQLLAVTDQLKFNLVDARDRTCLHYAAIKGKTNLINTLFMLHKEAGIRGAGADFCRAYIDPIAIFDLPPNQRTGTQDDKVDLKKLNADIQNFKKKESMNRIEASVYEGGESEDYPDDEMDAWNDDEVVAVEDNQDQEDHNFAIENASEAGGSELKDQLDPEN